MMRLIHTMNFVMVYLYALMSHEGKGLHPLVRLRSLVYYYYCIFYSLQMDLTSFAKSISTKIRVGA
jgi:hypothetical protein